MIRRRGVLAALVVALVLAGCGDQPSLVGELPDEINFSILSVEGQRSLQPLWDPLLKDLSGAVGVKVRPYWAASYSAIVEAMGSGEVQAGWFSARPALDAVVRSNAEVVARAVDHNGDATYRSVLIARRDRKIDLDDVMKCGRKLTFGIGDAQSTSGTLAPMTYLFAPRDVDPARCFKGVRAANHQANFLAVANGDVDVATNNTLGVLFANRENPGLAERVEVIWTSPPLPESSILVRKDLDPALREKIRQFFITYGTGTGPEADRQREVLSRLAYGGFRPADDTYLDPVREMVAGQELARARRTGDKRKVAAAEANFEKVRAAAAQRRAADPDI